MKPYPLRVMRLYIVARAAHVVLQLPPHRFEFVANRHIRILVDLENSLLRE